MWVWMGKLCFLAREASPERRGKVQERANRGVRMGVMRECVGSRVLMCWIEASESAMPEEAEASR